MKVRNDFVTNSSSASFILSMKGEFTEKQKEEILSYVNNVMLGRVVLTPESSEEEIREFINNKYFYRDEEKKIREALKRGESIRCGWVSFESENIVADMYTDIWDILKRDDNFHAIEDSLDY